MAERSSGHEFQLALLITPVRTDEGVAIMVADIFRLLLSLCIIVFAAVSCGWAIYAGVTLMPDSLPNYVVFIIFFFCLFMLAITEGLHVSAVQVAYQDHNQYLESHPRAAAIMKYQNEGRNLQHFLIGRQIIVLFSVFVLGRCTTFDAFIDSFPSWIVTYIMYSGFLGVVLVVQIGQLVPQILSSNFPVGYMNLRVVSWIYYLCLALEQTGICYTVWLICWCIHRCYGRQEDDNVVDMTSEFEYITHSDLDTKKRVLENLRNLKSTLNLKEAVNNPDLESVHDEKMDINEVKAQRQPLLSINSSANSSAHSSLNVQSGDPQQPLLSVQNGNATLTVPKRKRFKFPSKAQCAQGFNDADMKVPGFLLSEDHPDYIPAHLLLMHMLQSDDKQ